MVNISLGLELTEFTAILGIMIAKINSFRSHPALYPGHVWLSIYLYSINILCLSVCLYPINVKTAEPIGPKICVGPCMTCRKGFINAQSYIKLFPKFISMREKIFLKNLRNFLVIFVCFILYKEKMLTDRATLKS